MRVITGARGGLAVTATALLCAIGHTSTARAEETVAEEILDILRAAGTIDEAKYESLRNRARAEEKRRIDAAVERAVEQAQLAAVSAANEPGPEDWDFKWSNGFKLKRKDGAFDLAFGGRIQNDWALIDLDDSLEDNIGGEGNGTEFRRARIFFEGTVYERLFFKAQYDFANTGAGTTAFKDVYMGLKDLGPVDYVRVGHQKEPFSIEELGSSKYTTFLERALPNVFAPSRNTGIMVSRSMLDDRLLTQFGTFKNTNDSGFDFGDNSSWNITTRIAGTPIYAEEGARVLHLGLAHSHQFRGGNFAERYRQRPEAHLAQRFVDTGQVMNAGILRTNDIDLINVGLAWVEGPASLQSEYTHTFVNGRGSADNTDFWGTYVQASYFLTGEHRNYSLSGKEFGRVKPIENFNPAKGDWGGWEVAGRFSYLDLDDGFVQGGEMWDLTFGLNWYLYPNARVMMNYIHSHLDDRTVLSNTNGAILAPDVDGNGDIVQVRFQVDF